MAIVLEHDIRLAEDSSTTSSSTSNSATETAKRKTVKFRESSRKKHDHVRSPVFVNRRSGGGGGSGASHHLLKNADVIISVDQLQQQQQLSHPNYWESYYGTDTAAAPDQKPYKSGNSTSSSSQSLYNTPYYDYRREQSKVRRPLELSSYDLLILNFRIFKSYVNCCGPL